MIRSGPCRIALGRTASGPRGFTLIELMVVVAIIVLAMGIMAPTLLEYFRNQKLKNVRVHFVQAFNVGRLMAITEGSRIRVVFFKEGVRVYHVKNREFRREEEFIPESAPGALKQISFNLRFARKTNADLPGYREWEKTQPGLTGEASGPEAGKCDVSKLIAIEFQRDGSVLWLPGDDVPTTLFNRRPIPDADIIAMQEGNPEALFIDIRNTGPVRTEMCPVPPSLVAAEEK